MCSCRGDDVLDACCQRKKLSSAGINHEKHGLRIVLLMTEVEYYS